MNQPAAQYPTAEEFVARWEQLPHAERLATAERMLTSASMAATCFMADHQGRMGSLQDQLHITRAALLEAAPLAVEFNTPAEIIRGLAMQRDRQRDRAEAAEARVTALKLEVSNLRDSL